MASLLKKRGYRILAALDSQEALRTTNALGHAGPADQPARAATGHALGAHVSRGCGSCTWVDLSTVPSPGNKHCRPEQRPAEAFRAGGPVGDRVGAVIATPVVDSDPMAGAA